MKLKTFKMLKLSKYLYVSTITSLREDEMLKIDVSPGEYKLTSFHEGYVFSKTDNLKDLELVKVFYDRDGDKGLSGTYWGGESDEHNQLRLFKTWLSKRFNDFYEGFREPVIFDDDYDSDEDISDRIHAMKRKLFKYDDYEARKFDFEAYNNFDFYAAEELEREERHRSASRVVSFNTYHNLPFIFYLNKQISNYDLLQLEEVEPIENCGYLWKVNQDDEHIGYVVEKKLHCMLGDQAGIGIFEQALAFGNFNIDTYLCDDRRASILEDARDGYKCLFDNCECDTQCDYIKEWNKRMGWD